MAQICLTARSNTSFLYNLLPADRTKSYQDGFYRPGNAGPLGAPMRLPPCAISIPTSKRTTRYSCSVAILDYHLTRTKTLRDTPLSIGMFLSCILSAWGLEIILCNFLYSSRTKDGQAGLYKEAPSMHNIPTYLGPLPNIEVQGSNVPHKTHQRAWLSR